MTQVTALRERKLFISYRRADSVAAARGLLRFWHAHYGKDSVFLDTAEIRIGTDWPLSLERALDEATVVVPIIGRNWFMLKDPYNQRRIDQPNDWVAREISNALETGKLLVPVYVAIPPPPRDAFPDRLKALADRQGIVVTDEDAESGWKKLADALNFGQLKAKVRYPRAMVQLEPLTSLELRSVLAGSELRGWREVASPLPDMEHVVRSELHACFEFESFEVALEFMCASAEFISRTQHHPRWEHIWRSVNVYLSTWDLQFQISRLDTELALHLTKVAHQHRGRLL